VVRDASTHLCRHVKGGGRNSAAAAALVASAAAEKEKKDKASTLVTVKLLFLLFYGSLGAVMPYLPVYYHSLGLPDKQIGQLGAITPAVTFVVAPLWGALADQTGRHKDVLLFTFVFSVVSRLLFIWRTTFGWLSILVFCTAVLNAPVRPLLDSSVLNLLEDKREYGKQRLWGQFGFGLAGCIVGPLLMSHKFGGYKAAFYVHALISLPTLMIMRRFNPTPASLPSSPAPALKKDGKKRMVAAAGAKGTAGGAVERKPHFKEGLGIVIRNPDALIFFFLVFVIGVSSGIIENFAYKRLREVGGEGTVMGVSRFFSSVTGVPMFWFSGHVTKRLSVMGVLILSLCSYMLRFFIYASITNPWQGLPAEALRGFTFAAMWASSTYYTHKISPPGLSATMLGFLNGMYGGLGQSTGALIGGHLSQRYGTPRTFVLSGLADLVVVGLFGTYWWLHPNATRLKEE
jgi:MFS family permease